MRAEVDIAGNEGRIQAFSRKHQTGLVTLVFTDLVGSTQLKQRLGDWLGVRRIQEHHDMVRRLLAGFPEAAEISTAGDSFFLAFARPSDAVLFALGLQNTLRNSARPDETPLRDRVGIHLGEVVIEKADHRRVHDLYGIQVDLCARLMSLAGADQILTSSLVFESAREAVARGSSDLGAVRWERHGRYTLKGIDLPVEVHEVGEAGVAPFWKPPGALIEGQVADVQQVSELAADPTPHPARRLPWTALSVGVALLILGGLLGWRWLSPRTERLAILPFHSLEADPRADDFGVGLAERVEARLQEQVAESRTLRFSPLRDAVENGVTNAALAGSKLAADLVVEGSVSAALNRRRLKVSLQARAANGAFIERRSGDVTQKPEETLAQFEERLAGLLAGWLGASGSKGGGSGGSHVPAVSEEPSPPVDPQVAELHLEGLGALRNRHVKGSLEKAVRDLRLAHTQRPEDRDICADYAEALFWTFEQNQDPEDLILAETVAERNALRKPASGRASAVLGMILVLTDRPSEAVPHLRKALELSRSNSRARVDLAWALGKMGQTEEASAEFDRATALDRGDWYAYNLRGKFLMGEGLFDLAEQEFQKVARIAPGNYQGTANAGTLALLHRGDRPAGRKLLEEALANNPSLVMAGEIRMRLGWALLVDEPDRALRELERATREAPGNIGCAMVLGEALMSRGDSEGHARALVEYERALRSLDQRIRRLSKHAINSANDRMDRSLCLAALGRSAEAMTELGRLLSESQKNPDAWLVSAIVESMAGQKDRALESMRMAHRLGISEERMSEEWPLRPLLKDFKGDERSLKKKT
jgi:class 3 adenylate cyclase/Flp pilus assembly protein TadD/TolB-like protein